MRKIIILAAALLALFPCAVLAQSDGYDGRSYVRMSYVRGDVYVQRGGDLGYEQGEVNLVVVAGDKIGTRAGRLELQLGGRNYLRLDNDTVVEIAALPGGDSAPTKIHVLAGSVYVRIRSLGGGRNFDLHSPDASFYPLGPGLFRVDVREGVDTEFGALEGEAEAAGGEGSVVVRSGERITAADGRLLEEGSSSPGGTDFHAWNDSRDAVFARAASGTYLPAEYADYEAELSEYGRWSYESDYGSVWVPRTSYVDWRPYQQGRWVWYPIIGWTWVAYEPWGWCTSHYGRWGWGAHLGWYWIPTRHWGWGPAWVHWTWDRDYIGWCPLSYYNRPAVLVGNRFYDRYSFGDFPLHSRTLTMVRRGQLQDRDLRGRALSGAELSRVGRINLRNTQPDQRPSLVRNGELASRARGVVSRDGGRGVVRNFGAGQSRTAPDALRRTVIRKSGAAEGLERSPAGGRTGEAPGNRVIRRNESVQAPTERRLPGLSRTRPAESGPAPRVLREFPSRNGRDASAGRAVGPVIARPAPSVPSRPSRSEGSDGRAVRETPPRPVVRLRESSGSAGPVIRSRESSVPAPRIQRPPLSSRSRESGSAAPFSPSRILREPRPSSGSAGSRPSIPRLSGPSRLSPGSARPVSRPPQISASPRSVSRSPQISASRGSSGGSSRSSGSSAAGGGLIKRKR